VIVRPAAIFSGPLSLEQKSKIRGTESQEVWRNPQNLAGKPLIQGSGEHQASGKISSSPKADLIGYL
jgi:hypothetical protein